MQPGQLIHESVLAHMIENGSYSPSAKLDGTMEWQEVRKWDPVAKDSERPPMLVMDLYSLASAIIERLKEITTKNMNAASQTTHERTNPSDAAPQITHEHTDRLIQLASCAL